MSSVPVSRPITTEQSAEHGAYFLVLDDALAATWLVAKVAVDGPAVVVSRWTTRAQAEADASRWSELAAGVA